MFSYHWVQHELCCHMPESWSWTNVKWLQTNYSKPLKIYSSECRKSVLWLKSLCCVRSEQTILPVKVNIKCFLKVISCNVIWVGVLVQNWASAVVWRLLLCTFSRCHHQRIMVWLQNGLSNYTFGGFSLTTDIERKGYSNK